MEVYVGCFVLSELLLYISHKTKVKKFIGALLCALPLILVSGFRWYVGTDFQSYLWGFISVSRGRSYGFEILIEKISYVTSLITKNIQMSFVVFAFITIFFIMKGILEHSNSPGMSIFLFFTLGYFFSSMNIVRQFVAVAIIFMSMKYLVEKNWKLYILMVLLAVGFHTSAIVAGVLLFICQFEYTKKQYILMTVSAFFLGVFQLQIKQFAALLFPRYSYVILKNVEALGIQEILYYSTVFSACLVLGIMFFDSIIKNRKNMLLFNTMFFTWLIYFFMNGIPLVNRLAVYSEIFVILYLPMVFRMLKKSQRYIVVYCCVIACCIIFVLTIFMPNRYDVFPYQYNFYF